MSSSLLSEIYEGYRLYPSNYIAYDELNGTTDYAANFTANDKKQFDEYIDGQIAKVDLPDKDETFLRERLLTMYANPLRHHLKVEDYL